MRRLLCPVLIGLAVLLAVPSCKQSTSDPILGTWDAVTFNVGGTLYTLPITHGMTSIAATFQSDGTWTAVQVDASSGSPVTSYPQGTWSVSGSTYTIIQTSPPPAAPSFTGTLSGNTVTSASISQPWDCAYQSAYVLSFPPLNSEATFMVPPQKSIVDLNLNWF